MKCYNHPDRDAVGVCVKCGKAVCVEDSVVIDGKLYCKDCATTIPNKEVPKKLYRSTKNRILFGVCGGVAEFIGIDPTIVRVLWAILSLFYGTGIIIYIILCLIIPNEPN